VGGVGSSHRPNEETRYVWSGARALDGLGVRHAPCVFANCRWWPDFLGPRRLAGASVVNIGVTGVGGIELSGISMVKSSAGVTWLVLVIVIPVLVSALGRDVKGSLPLPPAASSRERRAEGASSVLLHFFIGGSIVVLPCPVASCSISDRVGQCPPFSASLTHARPEG